MLPKLFLERMGQLLGSELDAFLDAYEKPAFRALRVNSGKADRERFLKQAPFALQPVSWEPCGYYYQKDDTPGKHPYHEAGVYYIQEPSAMAPAGYLMAEDSGSPVSAEQMEQERILDLCAAPGGKSTQIAAKMGGKGILISNEIHPSRARILSQNIERMGITNAMVLNETPEKLCRVFDGFFTRILVDAPCSGEGMFRKNGEAVREWSMENITLCADRQDKILDCAASMLAPGGKLVYSTCTFAPEENEGSISRFLRRHPEFYIVPVNRQPGMCSGMPELAECSAEGLEHTVRLFPHRIDGEGHFIAALRKQGQYTEASLSAGLGNGIERGLAKGEADCTEWKKFAEDMLKFQFDGKLLRFGDYLYRIPQGMPSVQKLKVLRQGLWLGTLKKNRLEPSHALALALKPEQAVYTADFSYNSGEIRAYLNGQTIPYQGENGWYLVLADGYGIGWGKLVGGIMKNHYPKGLRILL